MIRLSAVVITYNESQNIARCLDSLVEVADEIVVVDSYSEDSTSAICQSYDLVRFLQHPFEGHIQQKNWAMQQASSDYILSLDADECLDEKLITSIRSIKANWQGMAYQINRLTNFCGKWVRHGGWHPDWNTRLFDRRTGQWGGTNPHDRFMLKSKGFVQKVHAGVLLHYSFNSQSQYVQQLDKFTTIKAEALYAGKKGAPIWKFTIYPAIKFVQHYVIRLGFLDGIIGFIVAKNSAYYTFSTYSKLWLMHNQHSVKN